MAGKKFTNLDPTTDIDGLLGAAENSDGVTPGNKFGYSKSINTASPSDAVVLTEGAIDDIAIYQNPLPTTHEVGGIPVGSPFFNTPKSFAQFAQESAYPFQSPAFTSFAISGQAAVLELGDSISGSEIFSWSTSFSGNVAVNSINIYRVTGGLTPLLTGIANSGTAGYFFPVPIKLTSLGSYVFRIEGTDIDSPPKQFTRDVTYNWYPRKFWGTNANATLTESEVEALVSQALSNTTAGTYSFAAVTGQYKHFAFESSLPQPDYLTDFKDQSNGLNVAMEPPYTISVTNAFSVTKTYNIYRTTYQLGGAITIIVSN